MSITGLPDLPDDLQGKIYAILAPPDRAAFRRSHPVLFRSPSIGARIKGIDMRGQPHPKGMSGPARITAILSAFPANAELKELCFNRVKDMDALLKLLLGGEAEASVRMRCSTVDKLSFQDCAFDESSASSLPLLFPKLCDAQAKPDLSLIWCQLSDGFLGALMPKLQLHALCIGLDAEHPLLDLSPLAGHSSLHHLSLDALQYIVGEQRFDVSGLSDLPQLESLSLSGCGPVGFGSLIERSKALRAVSMHGDIVLPTERFVCASLHTLDIGDLNFSFLEGLHASDLPVLQELRVGGICLDECFAPELGGGVVSLAERMASWLLSFPLGAVKCYNDFRIVRHEDFSTIYDETNGDPGALPEYYAQIMRALQPLKPCFSTVSHLLLHFSDPPVALVCHLFGGLKSLKLRETCYDIEHGVGLTSAFSALPQLELLEVCAVQPPSDLLAVLKAALLAMRQLSITISVDLLSTGDSSASSDDEFAVNQRADWEAKRIQSRKMITHYTRLQVESGIVPSRVHLELLLDD